MTYYANNAAPYLTCNGVVDLLATGDGRCGSFQELMIDVLLEQGIVTAHPTTEEPLPRYEAAAITDYVATYGSDPTLAYTIREVFFVKSWTLNVANRFAPIDNFGAPAQGNKNPIAIFGDHALVEIGGKIYDPSYGTGPFNSVLDWEDASIDGYGVQFIDRTGQASGFVLWVGSLDVKGNKEVVP